MYVFFPQSKEPAFLLVQNNMFIKNNVLKNITLCSQAEITSSWKECTISMFKIESFSLFNLEMEAITFLWNTNYYLNIHTLSLNIVI